MHGPRPVFTQPQGYWFTSQGPAVQPPAASALLTSILLGLPAVLPEALLADQKGKTLYAHASHSGFLGLPLAATKTGSPILSAPRDSSIFSADPSLLA